MACLDQLISLSARLGRDLDLVQAGGGNTSLKQDGTLWIKASGKWLIHADKDDMFLPVPMADIERGLAAKDEKFQEYRTRSGVALRPSVETTMHAVLPQSIVIHVHSVRTIAWASRADGQEGLTQRLQGLRWRWIPYTHPGIPLTERIQQELVHRPDILILANHGLVVAADDCAAAETLLQIVEERIGVARRETAAATDTSLAELAAGTAWEVAPDAEVHALAASSRSCEIALGGTLFPDQCVYLGPGAGILEAGETPTQTAERYAARYGMEPVFLLVPGRGVLTRKDLQRSARELLFGLKRVVERIPEHVDVTYLPEFQVARLLNWDAEKYRIEMARAAN
jgi:rhamnose utilization protein RhaD (predicted bifunctional aldolase and dehydrogenase)